MGIGETKLIPAFPKTMSDLTDLDFWRNLPSPILAVVRRAVFAAEFGPSLVRGTTPADAVPWQ